MPLSLFAGNTSLLHSPSYHHRRNILRIIAFSCCLLNWYSLIPFADHVSVPDCLLVVRCSYVDDSLCAGSILLYALYSPQFQTRLEFTQLEINGIFIAGEIGMYLTVP